MAITVLRDQAVAALALVLMAQALPQPWPASGSKPKLAGSDPTFYAPPLDVTTTADLGGHLNWVPVWNMSAVVLPGGGGQLGVGRPSVARPSADINEQEPHEAGMTGSSRGPPANEVFKDVQGEEAPTPAVANLEVPIHTSNGPVTSGVPAAGEAPGRALRGAPLGQVSSSAKTASSTTAQADQGSSPAPGVSSMAFGTVLAVAPAVEPSGLRQADLPGLAAARSLPPGLGTTLGAASEVAALAAFRGHGPAASVVEPPGFRQAAAEPSSHAPTANTSANAWATAAASPPAGVLLGQQAIPVNGNGAEKRRLTSGTPSPLACRKVAGVSNPNGVAVDGAGTIFVGEYWSGSVTAWVTDVEADKVTVATGAAPFGMAVSSEGHVIAVFHNDHVVKAGLPGTTWSRLGDGELDKPTGVALDAAENILVADWNNKRIMQYDKLGSGVWSATGSQVFGTAGNPGDVFVRNGAIYVTEQNQVTRWEAPYSSGTVVAGSGLSSPSGLYVDHSGVLYIADTWNHRIVAWPPGEAQGVPVLESVDGETLKRPHWIYSRGDHLLYVPDTDRARVLECEGLATTTWTTTTSVDITTTSSTSTTSPTATTSSTTSVSATTSTAMATVTETSTTSSSSTTKTALETQTSTAGITTAATTAEAAGTTVPITMLVSTASEVAAAVHVLTTAGGTEPDSTIAGETSDRTTAHSSAADLDSTTGPDAIADKITGMSTAQGSATNPDTTAGPETMGVSTTGGSATILDANADSTIGPDATTTKETKGESTTEGSATNPDANVDATTGSDATTEETEAVFARSAGPASTAAPEAAAPQGTELQSAEAWNSQTRPETLRSSSSAPEATTTTEDEFCAASPVLEQARERTQQLLPQLRASGDRSAFLRQDCGNTVLTPLGYASLVGQSTTQPPAGPGLTEWLPVPVPRAETVVELPRSLLEMIRPQVPVGDEVVLSVTTILGKETADMASSPPPGIAGDTIDVSGAAVIDLALLSGAFINISKLPDPMLFTLPVPFAKGLLGARWDEEAESWRRDGASASPGESGDVVKCSTRHLGLFAALFWGFVDAFLCSQFSLLTRERIDQVRHSSWAVGATMWTICWACWLGLAAVVLVLERKRRTSHPWRDEFLFFIKAPEKATESAELARVNTEMEESQSSHFLKPGVLRSASSVFRGSTTIMRDILDDVCSKYFEYFSETRSTIEDLLKNCTRERLRCINVRVALQKVLNQMVHGMSSRMAGALMNMDQDLVACITQDDAMCHVLAAVRGDKVEEENGVLFHNDQVEMWAQLHNQLLDHVDRHLTKTSWCDAKSVATLIWSQMPLGSMMSFNVFTSCRKKLFFTMLEFQGALMCSVGFFATSGSVRGKQLGNVPMCDPPEAASYYGRLFALSTASLLVAWLPVAALQSLQTRRLVHGSMEDMAKLLRAWKTQDKAIYFLGTLYLAVATFLVAVFLANLDAEDNVDMATSMATTALQEHLLAPIAYGLTMPFLAQFMLCAASRMSRSRRHQMVHAVRDAFYKSAIVQPPSVDI